MISRVNTWTLSGVKGCMVDVEVDLSGGFPSFQIVGLPEASVRESRDRVRAAIKNSQFKFPKGRIIVNLSPGDIKKEGTGFDLPIAMGILADKGIIPKDVMKNYLISGELSLDGRIKPGSGTLSGAILAREKGYKGIIVPMDNFHEASFVKGIDTIPVKSLLEAVMIVRGEKSPEDIMAKDEKTNGLPKIDFNEVKGQDYAKRALEIAAGGGHNLLMSGPPGSGKTMLAKRLTTILPELDEEEFLEVSLIYSAAGLIGRNDKLIKSRPFRAPHHTISYAGLIGGGRIPKPGEVSLAHKGVLFLDELPEFRRDNIEMLRQPLEGKSVIVSRAEGSIDFPADFILIAAMNPCPCGYLTSRFHSCRCSPNQITKYSSKLSGPILDRIDMNIEVTDLSYSSLRENSPSVSSSEMKERVFMVRNIQKKRYGSSLVLNSSIGKNEMERFCGLDNKSNVLLKKAYEKFGFSGRSVDRIIKVARTIADFDKSCDIRENHLGEALQYRMKFEHIME